MIKEVTTQRRMPPWHADPRFGNFANDRRLTRDEIDTLAAWVDGGMPKGDDKDLPKPIKWPKGWVHGKPDLVFTMPEEFEVPADRRACRTRTGSSRRSSRRTSGCTIAEGRPGVAGVVHHVVAYIMQEGQNGAGVAGRQSRHPGRLGPGDLGLVCPPDTALRVPKGCELRLEMHYTPNGKKTKDRSSVGITFAKKPPKYELFLERVRQHGFEVAGRTTRTTRPRRRSGCRPTPGSISLTPHMHWRGKDYFYEAIYPDGKKETLLSVPRWDFNWQSSLPLRGADQAAQGDEAARGGALGQLEATTRSTRTRRRRCGSACRSWDEMMVGFAAYVWERPETAAELAKNPPKPADADLRPAWTSTATTSSRPTRFRIGSDRCSRPSASKPMARFRGRTSSRWRGRS